MLASAVKELTGLPNKIISFNSVDDENLSIKNGKIEEKFGSYYFDNVEYIKLQLKIFSQVMSSKTILIIMHQKLTTTKNYMHFF